jgi:DNA repair protein RadC
MSEDIEKTKKDISLNVGHRARFIKTGADSLQDYELLEILLF